MKKPVGAQRKEFRGAFKLHEQFREAKPTRSKRVKINVPSAMMLMGTVESICYRTTHKGVAHLYKHDFAPGSRPFLAAGAKRNQLFFVEGRYHVTDRGIVDLDAKGREIDDAAHGTVLEDE
jgi:hypothetical protein